MDWLLENLLTITIFLPTLGALVITLVPAERVKMIRVLGLVVALLVFIVSLFILYLFQSNAAFQFQEQVSWIPNYGVSYHVGVDGISLLMILLTTFLTPITILSAFSSINKRVKGFMAAMLLMETGMLGVFAALDLFLFYIFWEAMLIPMYLIIGMWGGKQRIYASLKFILFTMVGSLLMLVAILALYSRGYEALGFYTTDYLELAKVSLSPQSQTWMFLAFALSFGIKVPLFPFHTWLPDAHVQAPTPGSVILAGVLLKMGGYGFLRFCLPLFPEATARFTPLLVALAVIGIVYGALVALVQTDMKKLVAYSSVSHLGYVVLGIFAVTLQSVSGSIIQMVNHGLSTGALFLLVGFIYERTHTREISDYGGLAEKMPRFAVVFIIVTLASIGMPGLNGFVGEFLIILGSYPTQPVGAIVAALGVILSAAYLLWMVHRVFFGPQKKLPGELGKDGQPVKDLSPREWTVILPILVMIVLLGVYPKPLLKRIEPAVQNLVETYYATQPAHSEGAARFGFEQLKMEDE